MPTLAQGTAAVSVQTPTTREELLVMVARRDELTRQLESLGERQTQLVNQRYNATVGQNPGLVAELDASIRDIQLRIVRVEREKLATDDAISAAIARGLSIPNEVEVVNLPSVPGVPAPGFLPPPPSPTDRLEIYGLIALPLLGLLAWRWLARRRHLRREQALPDESAATRDLRLAVETIALEVERISEGQRFITKLLAERGDVDPALLERGRSDKN